MLKERTFIYVSCCLFSVVGVLHLIRFVNGWDLIIGPWSAPVWLSGVAALFLGFMVYNATMLLGKKKKK